MLTISDFTILLMLSSLVILACVKPKRSEAELGLLDSLDDRTRIMH